MSKSDNDLTPGTSATGSLTPAARAEVKALGQEQQMALSSATIRYLNPDELYQPARHGFSQVTIVPAGTELVYISGQMAIDVDGKILAADFEGQVRGAFANLRLALEAVGSRMDHVVKVTILSADHDGERERIVARETNAAFPGPNKPASTLIPVPRLALDGIVFEIDAVAILPS